MTEKRQQEDVRPLKNKEDINNMIWALKKFGSQRDYILFLLGINTGLRVSDLLQLMTADIINLQRDSEKLLKVKEGKTGKTRALDLTSIYDDLLDYAEETDSKHLFPSRKGNKPISTTQAYRILRKGAYWAEIDHVGTHTMRKTYGYHLYQYSHKDLALVQQELNHRNSDVTLRYIGLDTEERSKKKAGFRLG